jgi:FkbM family methyltransferase
MHFDFIDIGTSDFDTSASIALATETVLLIEPISEYLESLPGGVNCHKENYAVGQDYESVEIYYVPPKTIQELNLPDWVRGSNSIGTYHPIVKDLLESSNISLDVVKKERVKIVPLDFLIQKYNITSVKNLKVDTEGYDHFIIDQVYSLVNNGLDIKYIKFEYNSAFGNTYILDVLAEKFVKLGYHQSWSKKRRDIILTK